ncbi:uncharacterized protein LOC100844728 [Brachypodium distachyon]|uniref:uncharacterized protein LOC100844728 n=1 Tax=Brachypodium distachyon TaxID=15368 RepID=UPI000D0DB04E|nr:uncharacterized protein LOC100844728 [Brachypodium distachyon]|eukprot:XP_024312853.1 uncharacterized protein LOC100844728 [Brachypodium distachyon]
MPSALHMCAHRVTQSRLLLTSGLWIMWSIRDSPIQARGLGSDHLCTSFFRGKKLLLQPGQVTGDWDRIIGSDHLATGAGGMPSKGPNVQFLGVILQCLCITASSQYFDPPGQSEQARDYLRFADVNRRCQSVLSSAKELTYDDNLPSRVKRELSFEKGDWHQDAGQAPLLPFDGGDAQRKAARWLPEPLSLATFEVTHVEDDDERRPRTAVNVSGVVILTVSRKSAGPEIGTYMSTVSPEFNISAGSTRLKIIFEGVYTERAKGRGDNYDGERVLCMLGSALLPKRSAAADGIDPWDWAKNSGRAGFQPPVTADNNILLVLQYPKELTLTTRAVLGKMRSTSAAPEAAYFDTVQLVAGLISYRASEYDFRPEALPDGAGDALSSSAADDPVFNRSMEDVYNGSYPCLVLDRYGLGGQVNTVLPGWRTQCNSTTGTCGHGVGPFDLGSAADAEVLAGVGIMMQDLQCQARHKDGYAIFGTATVSAVIRALPPWQDWRTAAGRSGLSGETLSAEGVWNASTGQVCMAACRGSTAGKEACRFRVCLLFPTTMSITARDTMLGRITSVDAHAPLVSFRQHMSPPRLWGYFPDDGQPLLPYRYSYTKVKQAGELRRKSASSFDLRKFIARTLSLRYPKRDGTEDHRRILSSLADTLTLCFMAVPSLFRQERIEQPVLHLEVFFLEQLVDRYVSP